MDYYFLDCHFNSQSLLLTRAGQSVPIRNNEARLLAFFLEDPARVASKETILDSVWVGKVVSEQAVFQAISNLRALFGDAAIKTFPKKGYQWQIVLAANAPVDTLIPLSPVGVVNRSAVRWRLPVAILSVATLSITALLIAVLLNGLITPDQANPPPAIVLAPFAIDASVPGAKKRADALQQALINASPSLSITLMPPTANAGQLLASPEHFYTQYQQTQTADILVAGRLWEANQKHYLAYYIQGRDYQWQGYLNADSTADMAAQLQQLLTTLAPVKLLWESKDRRLIDAQLQLLHNQYPQDLAIHHQLILNLMMRGDLQSARLHAQGLEQHAKNANSIIYQALALVEQAITSLETQALELNVQLMDKAVAITESVNAPLLQSQVREYYSTVHYRAHDFALLEKNLLQALALAQQANAPEQQARVLRALAIFSHKFNQPEKRGMYMVQARALFDHYNFPDESHALLDDMAGMFAQDPAQQEFFYRQTLTRFKPGQDAWVKERAQEHLVNLYISQQRWESALHVFANEQHLSGAELVMQAKTYWEQKKFQEAQVQAEQAFKQANLTGEYLASLDAALLLAQLHQLQPDLQKQYRDFIQQNASAIWKQLKAKPLAELGFLES